MLATIPVDIGALQRTQRDLRFGSPDYLTLVGLGVASAAQLRSAMLPRTLQTRDALTVTKGARTHSTIAALSSCVPTISLAYSVKARGIDRDVLGSLAYCIEPQEMNAGRISERVSALLTDAERLRAHLRATMPLIVERAYRAGAS